MRAPAYTPLVPARDRGSGDVVIFDGDCGMCRRWVRRLEAWDRDGVLETIPYQDPSVTDRFPWIPPDALREAVQVVAPDGRTWSGAGAAERLAHILPGGRPLAWLFRIPGVRGVADRVYRWVAVNRGPAGGCGLHCD
ncbi:MAG: DUF393 domain-containing protein [Gemmatimonadota bacterium]|jgi:predicted DCC family thiol-disulfide oxidoreductase YuxK